MRNPLAFAAGVMALLLARAVQPAEAEVAAAQATAQAALDQRVEKFLASHRGAWRDMNVPEVDGRTLRDLVVRKGFRRALEIGTSTGHSAIWIAWGLSRTGGRLITIDIDPERHREAVANFQAAGLSAYIDARGNRHSFTYDANGQRTEVIDPLGRITTATYDAVGQQALRHDPRNYVTTYSDDATRRPTGPAITTGRYF